MSDIVEECVCGCTCVFFYAWYCPEGARVVHVCARPHCVEVEQWLCVYVSKE